MAFNVSLNNKYLEEKIKEAGVKKQVIVYKNYSLIRSLAILIAVFWYYFFSGLIVLIRGKLPRNFRVPEKKDIDFFIEIINKPSEEEKKIKEHFKKYGRVVDLDEKIPPINLIS